jgi:FkbM family methyltransferase
MKAAPVNGCRGWRRKWNTFAKSARFSSSGYPGALLFRLALRVPSMHGRQFRCSLDQHPFWVRPVDSIGFEEILLKGEYAFVARILAGDPRTAPVVIDAGANVGLFSLSMLSARPDAVVHALEPDSHTFQILQRNVAASPRMRWHAHRLALWKTAGPLKFGATASSTGSHVHELSSTGTVETVDAVTLGGFLAQQAVNDVTVLKLDIEGAEEAVLRENEMVLDRVQHLVLEIHPAVVDQEWVVGAVERHFPFVHCVSGRSSSKPLLFASRSCKAFPND